MWNEENPVSKRSIAPWVTAIIFFAAVSLMVGLLLGNLSTQRSGQPFAISAAAQELFDESLLQALYEDAVSSVVEIQAFSSSGRGQGSGFLVSTDGKILTNNHVVQGAIRITVILDDGSRLSGEVISTSPEHDLAVVQVDAAEVAGLRPLTLADADGVSPGQLAIAIGSPFGLQGSVTVGIVSGLDRRLVSISGLIQTDAAIFPGNSGGPLINSSGEVIGINTAVLTGSEESFGFAVPSDKAMELLDETGSLSERAWLGVSIQELDAQTAAALGVAGRVYITDVAEGSPAEGAGLRAGSIVQGTPTAGGDVITSVDGVPVSGIGDLIEAIRAKRPGDLVVLRIERDGASIDVAATLGTWPVG